MLHTIYLLMEKEATAKLLIVLSLGYVMSYGRLRESLEIRLYSKRRTGLWIPRGKQKRR